VVVETKSSHTYTMDLCRSMHWNKCSEPECIFLTDEEEGQLCFDHKMALTLNKCSLTDCNSLTETEEGHFCLVHRPKQGELVINTQHMQKEEFIVKCDSCDFKTKGSKRGRLVKRLEKHREVCKAAMDTVAVSEQGNFMKNSVVENLRKADIVVGKFLRSDHNTYHKGRQMFEEVELISEVQQLVGVYKITSNAEGFNMGSTEIPKPKVGDVSIEELDTYIISETGVEGSFDKQVDMGEWGSLSVKRLPAKNLPTRSLQVMIPPPEIVHCQHQAQWRSLLNKIQFTNLPLKLAG
jgi:hypothetical protein